MWGLHHGKTGVVDVLLKYNAQVDLQNEVCTLPTYVVSMRPVLNDFLVPCRMGKQH